MASVRHIRPPLYTICHIYICIRRASNGPANKPLPTDHVIGSPLALSDKKYAEKAWVEYKHVKILQRPDVEFVHGSVTKVDPETQTATVRVTGQEAERTEKYDFFIGATGLRRAWPVVPQSLSRKDYLVEASNHIDAVLNGNHPVLVVGGGAYPHVHSTS